MTRDKIVRTILEDIKDTTTLLEIISDCEKDIEINNRIEEDYQKLIKYLIKTEKEKVTIGFEIGFDLIMILYGQKPKYKTLIDENLEK